MKRIALFLAIAAAAIACTNEETVTPELKVTSETADLVIPTEGGELTVAFNVNVDWTAEVKEAEAKEWCSLSPASGKPGDNTLKVIAIENEGTENRTVTVVLRALEATQEIVVTQLQKDALVLTGKKEFEVAYQGQSLEFAVSHNSELKATADVPWITEVKAKAVEESKLTFAVAANTGEARTGKITFEAGSLKEVVTVKQAAWTLEFTVTPAENQILEKEGGKVEVTVVANVEYDVKVTENDWIEVTEAEGVHTFTVKPHTVVAPREAEVTIAPKDDKYAESAASFKILQKGIDPVFAISVTEAQTFELAGGELEVTVDSNLEYEVTYDYVDGAEPWLTTAANADVYKFTVPAYEAMTGRTVVVYFTPKSEAYADLAKSVTINQNGHVVLSWTKVPTKEYTGYTAGPVRLAKYGEYLLVSNTDKILAINPQDGTIVESYALPEGFVCGSLCVDAGGNIIFANTAAWHDVLSVYTIKSLSDTPRLLLKYHTDNCWCADAGNIRVAGNIDEVAIIASTVVGGGNMWTIWEAKDGEVEDDVNGWDVFTRGNLPYTAAASNYACVIPAGPALTDGLWYVGYGGERDLQFCNDLVNNTWASVCAKAYGDFDLNPASATFVDFAGRSYAAVMAGAHWNYHDPWVILYDVTDKAAAQAIYNLELGTLAERNADWSLVNWTDAGAYSDVLAVPTATGVEIYFVDANFNMIGRLSVK